jgi:hypothetical protein
MCRRIRSRSRLEQDEEAQGMMTSEPDFPETETYDYWLDRTQIQLIEDHLEGNRGHILGRF